MNKYKNLMSNTLIFAIATFGSKLLPFLLLPLYTHLLPANDLGVTELITSACNLILPIMYLSMGEAVIRYGLDEGTRKQDVFTTAVMTVLLGYGALWLAYPLMRLVPTLNEYLWLIYLYCIASALHTVMAQFIRASGHVRLFAIDGIYITLMTVAMNVFLLVVLKMGIAGFVLSTIIADASSAVLLLLILRLHRFFGLRDLDGDVVRMMLRYAIPLVPTAVFWWVTTLSNRYFVKFMCDDASVGLYSVAQRLPNLVTLVSMVFTQAWQISAFTEYRGEEGERFYSTVFKSYYTFVFLAASGIVLICRPVLAVMAPNPSYDGAWRYTPFLVLAVAFSTLVTFLGTIYNAVQKNGMVMLTTFIAAALNILLNWLLIPHMGPQGAAIATFLSFFAVFAIRSIDSKKYIRIDMQPVRIAVTLVILLAQICVTLIAPPRWYLWSGLAFALLVAYNWRYIWFLLGRLLELARKKRA